MKAEEGIYGITKLKRNSRNFYLGEKAGEILDRINKIKRIREVGVPKWSLGTRGF